MGRLRRHMRSFGRDEDGSMIIFAMFIFLVMLMIGGMAVDLMRFETNRSRLQATLDRAVLASADLEQTMDPEEVVRDYFAKAGLLDQLSTIVVTEGFNSRSVQATASMDVNTMFMKLLGVDTLAAPAAGTAIENVSDIEIMLVLDVSGSMASNNKIVNLRNAASDFVDTVLAGDAEQRISIGMVPFNGQVNLGPVLRQRYNVIDLNGVANSDCVDLPAAAYAASDLSTSLSMPQTAFVDSFSGTSLTTAFTAISSNAPLAQNRWCPQNPGNIVRLPGRNLAPLHNNINGLNAVGATSINAGVRWALELLEPGSRGMFNTLISQGQIPGIFSGRPYDFGAENTMKVIVVMTDGEHFPEERVNAGYRAGLSPIYRSNGDGNFSIHHPTYTGSSKKYWVPHRNSGAGEWRSTPWNSGSGVTQQTWPQVWSRVRMKWVAWQLYARALGTNSTTRSNIYTTQMNTFRTYTPVAVMNDQLQGMCDMAKDEGVVIFGVAFEAPANGQEQIFNCASSPTHYYDAQGLEIGSAFRSIANQINSLRLIQ